MKTAVELLSSLVSHEFLDAIGVVTSASALYRLLRGEPLVRALRKCLASGELSEDGVRRYVAGLSRDFQSGTQFPHEIALAAIAVALESWNSSFADEYLRDLARLRRVSEFELAPGVADRCRVVKKQDAPAPRRIVRRLPISNKKWDIKRPIRTTGPQNLSVNIQTIALTESMKCRKSSILQ